jgi:hypothetical protein
VSAHLFHGLFELNDTALGTLRLPSAVPGPRAIPDPQTGRLLKVAGVELSDRGICPACTQLGSGGYVSFEADMRLAFACPACQKLVWIAGT